MKKLKIWRLSVVLVPFVLGSAVALAADKNREQRRAAGEIFWSAGDEPVSMDPTKQVDGTSYPWLGLLYEGLVTTDSKGQLMPGAAERWDISPDKKTWTFHIRKSAQWHDGKPVTATDFEYTFKRLVDPGYASFYSFIGATAGIINASDIIAKKKAPKELAVKALSPQTLEIRLERPVVFFAALMSFQSFYPVRQDLVEKFGDLFANDPASVIGNGPFRLASWKKEHSMRVEKFPAYWNAKAIKIQAVESPAVIKDAQSEFNAFSTGSLDFVSLRTPEVLKQAQEAKNKVVPYQAGCISFMALNVKPGRPFASKELRLAIQAGINRAEFVNKVIAMPGYKTANSMVPDFIPGAKPNGTFRKEVPLIWKDADLASSKRHIQAHLKSKGTTKVEAITILAGDSTRSKKYSEYWQSALTKILGSEVKVETLPSKAMVQKERDLDYDLALTGWCPDYRDAMTMLDFHTTTNENNFTGWSSPRYDELIAQAAKEGDASKRLALFAEAEAIYLADAPSIPYYQSGGVSSYAEGLSGVFRDAVGINPDFRYATWEQRPSAKR